MPPASSGAGGEDGRPLCRPCAAPACNGADTAAARKLVPPEVEVSSQLSFQPSVIARHCRLVVDMLLLRPGVMMSDLLVIPWRSDEASSAPPVACGCSRAGPPQRPPGCIVASSTGPLMVSASMGWKHVLKGSVHCRLRDTGTWSQARCLVYLRAGSKSPKSGSMAHCRACLCCCHGDRSFLRTMRSSEAKHQGAHRNTQHNSHCQRDGAGGR